MDVCLFCRFTIPAFVCTSISVGRLVVKYELLTQRKIYFTLVLNRYVGARQHWYDRILRELIWLCNLWFIRSLCCIQQYWQNVVNLNLEGFMNYSKLSEMTLQLTHYTATLQSTSIDPDWNSAGISVLLYEDEVHSPVKNNKLSRLSQSLQCSRQDTA